MIRRPSVRRVLLAMVAAAAASAGQAGVIATGQAPAVRVLLQTDSGPIEIDVDVAHAPVTAANFLKYVDAGAYDGGGFHRTVRPATEIRKDYPIQVIQAGPAAGKPGFPAIPLERTSVTGLTHVDGAVSMARSGPDSATSDFFICIGAQPELDFGGRRNADGQGFAVFGRVVSGMDVVRKIQAAPVEGGANPQALQPRIGILKAARKGAADSRDH